MPSFNYRGLHSFDVPTTILVGLVVVFGVGLLSGGAGSTGSTQTTLFISGGVILGLVAIRVYFYFFGPQTIDKISTAATGAYNLGSAGATEAYNLGSAGVSGVAKVPGQVASSLKTGFSPLTETIQGLGGIQNIAYSIRNSMSGNPTTSTTPPTKFIDKYGVAMFIGLAALIGIGVGLNSVKESTDTLITFVKYVGAFFGFFILVLLLSFMSSQQERPGQFLPTALLRMLYYFLPYGLITFAALSDMFNFEYKYLGGIFTAIGAFITNYLFSKMTSGNEPTIDSNYCGIPGLSIFGSKILPQGMLFNLTTLSYLATLLTLETNQNPKYTIPSWTFLIAVFGLSAFTTNYNECFNEKALNNNHGYLIIDFFKSRNFSQNMGVTFLNMATLAAALGFGAVGASIHYFGVMRREGFAGHIDPKVEKDAKNKQDENIVNVSTALSEVCPAIAEDQIVAEIYQNGKKLGDSIQ